MLKENGGYIGLKNLEEICWAFCIFLKKTIQVNC